MEGNGQDREAPSRITATAISLGQKKCSGLKPFKFPANQSKCWSLRFAGYRPRERIQDGSTAPLLQLCLIHCESQTWRQQGSSFNLASSLITSRTHTSFGLSMLAGDTPTSGMCGDLLQRGSQQGALLLLTQNHHLVLT